MTNAAPPLSLEEFAKTTALLRAHEEQGTEPAALATVLAAAGLASSDWDAVARHWNDCLEADAASGDTAKARAFARAYDDERERLGRQGLPRLPDSPGAAATPNQGGPGEGGAFAQPPAPIPTPPAVARWHPGRATVAAIDETSTDFRALGPELPFHEGAAPSPAFLADLQASPPQAAVRSGGVDSTYAVELSDLDLSAPVTPFFARRAARPGVAGGAASVAPVQAPSTPRPGVGGGAASVAPVPAPSTPSDLDATSAEVRAVGPELPFPEGAPPGAFVAALAAGVPLGAASSTDVGSTMAVNLSDLDLRDPATPFAHDAAQDPRPAPTPSASRAPAPASIRSDSTPLTLEQYASLRAELAVAPRDAGAVLARYRLPDAAALARLDAAWAQRFEGAPAERRRFEALLGDFVLHLRRRGGGSGQGM